MRVLFCMGEKSADGRAFIRPSARCIAIEGDRVAMVHSLQYDYYKFPGGGIEPQETREQALVRETQEEAGLLVIPDSIREFGCVRRDNFYYLCWVDRTTVEQRLDDYEAQEQFTLEWVQPKRAIEVNRTVDHGPKSQNMLEREARVLEILQQEGYFSTKE